MVPPARPVLTVDRRTRTVGTPGRAMPTSRVPAQNDPHLSAAAKNRHGDPSVQIGGYTRYPVVDSVWGRQEPIAWGYLKKPAGSYFRFTWTSRW